MGGPASGNVFVCWAASPTTKLLRFVKRKDGSYVGYDPALLVPTFVGFVNAHVFVPLHQNTFGIFCLYVKTRLRGTPPEIKGNLLPAGGLVRN